MTGIARKIRRAVTDVAIGVAGVAIIIYFKLDVFTVIYILIALMIIGVIPIVFMIHRDVAGGARNILSVNGRYRIRLWMAQNRDKSDMALHLITSDLMERHRGRTGCSGERCVQHRSIPLPRSWETIRTVAQGSFYCHSCGTKVSR